MKNLKNFICHLGTLLTSILAIVFLTQAQITLTMGGKSESVGAFDLNMQYAPDTFVAAYAFAIIATVALSLVILVSIINILVDFNVIKSNKLFKIVNIVSVALAVLSLVAIFICMAVQVIDYNGDAIVSKLTTYSIGWGAIVNLILCVVINLFCFMADKGKKKSSKK